MIEINLNPNQINFFNALQNYKTIIDSGDWRAGKSFELCVFAIERMAKYSGINEFMGRRTLKSLKETTFLKFQEVLRNHYKLQYGRDYRVLKNPPLIIFPNGSQCTFGDLEDVDKWLSAEYSDILIDQAEQITENAFQKIKSRQTQLIIQKQSDGENENKTLLVMNPPEIAEQHWTHKKFRDPNTKIKNSLMLYSSVRNNKENIPNGYIEEMENSIDERTAMIYLGGGDKWIPMLSKVVYSDYDFESPEGNLRKLKYNDRYENYISMDFGWTHPMSIGCWQWDKENDIFYRLYEVVESHVKPETYCDLLQGKTRIINGTEYTLPITTANSTIVPLIEAKQRRQESGGKSNLMLMKEIFAKRGVDWNYRLSNVGIHSGILAVRRHIKTKTGERKIFIDPSCERFIKDAQTYHYPVDREGNVTSEIPEKDDISDHTQDETRGLVGMLSPIRTQPEWSVKNA